MKNYKEVWVFCNEDYLPVCCGEEDYDGFSLQILSPLKKTSTKKGGEIGLTGSYRLVKNGDCWTIYDTRVANKMVHSCIGDEEQAKKIVKELNQKDYELQRKKIVENEIPKEKKIPKAKKEKMPKAVPVHLQKWFNHLQSVRQQHPGKSLKECMKIAKQSYKK